MRVVLEPDLPPSREEGQTERRSVTLEPGPVGNQQYQFERPPSLAVAQPERIQEENPEVLEGPRVGGPMARQAARIRAAHPQPQNYPMMDYPMVAAGAGALPAASDPTSALYYALPMADRAGREELLRQRYPNAVFSEDRYGNPTVRIDGNTYYMERPDPLNPQNVRGVLMRAAPSAVLGGLVAAAGPAAPVAVAAGQGLAGVGGNYLSQLIPIAAGSGQQINWPEVITEGAVSAATPFAPAAVRQARRVLESAYEGIASRLSSRRPTQAEDFLRGSTPFSSEAGASSTMTAENLPYGTQRLLSRKAEELYPQDVRLQDEIKQGRYPSTTPGPFPTEFTTPSTVPPAPVIEQQLPRLLERLKGPSGAGSFQPPTSVTPPTLADVMEQSGIARYPDMMPIDRPTLLGYAEREVARNTSAGRYINRQLEARAAERPARVADDLGQAFGPLSPSEAKFFENIRNERQGYATELQRAFDNAPLNVDVSNIRERIRYLMEQATPRSPEYNALMRINDYFGGANQLPLGRLHEIKDNIWTLSKFGDDTLGIKPGVLTVKDSRVKSLGDDINQTLRNTSPRYADVMDNYVSSYEQINAFEAGRNALSAGRNLVRPDQVAGLLADRETADAFRAGMRQSIEDKLRTSPNDLSAAARMIGGEGDYVRQNIASTFGQEAVDQILRTADREALYKTTEDAINRAAGIGSRGVGARISEEAERPPIDISAYPFPFQQAAAKGAQSLVHGALHTARGERGPAFERGMAAFLTSRGEQQENLLRGIMQRKANEELAKQAMRYITPAAGIAGAEIVRSQSEPRFAGGRVGRASGGRLVRNDHSARAAALIKAADSAKKAHNDTTKEILDQPDEAVAKALSIANQAI